MNAQLKPAALEIKLAAENLTVARLLAANGHFRQAVATLYFAAYHTVVAVLAAQGIDVDYHEGVPAMFGQHFIRSGLVEPDAAELLGVLYHSRIMADYGGNVGFDRTRYLLATSQAARVIEACCDYLRRDFPSLDLAGIERERAELRRGAAE